jgi:FtsP/CotA-like multicopper oxidase with cupredoxin domain
MIKQVIFLIILLFSFSAAYAENKNIDLIVAYKTVRFAGKSVQAISVNNQIPAPTLHFKEGDKVTLRVHNHLDKGTAIHWHGILLPWKMDGVEGVTQEAIPPGGSFQYQFTLKQSGTYWYHAHAGFQEQQGLYGAFIIVPKPSLNQKAIEHQYTKDYVIVLSDWINTDPNSVLANLKKDGDYYSPNFPLQPSLVKFMTEYKKSNCTQRKKIIADYKMMQAMRMSIYDFADVAYDVFLLNGQTRSSPWTAPVVVGDLVRLRFIGAGASTIFHVKIPEATMQMIHVQGNDIEPYDINDFSIAPGETYDVLVNISENKPYIIYAESADTLGAAVGALITQPNQKIDISKITAFPEPEPVMMGIDHGAMKMDHGAMNMNMNMEKISNTSVTMGTKYQNLKSEIITNDPNKPVQEIKMELSGFMGKYQWFINGVPEHLAEPIVIYPHQRYRLVFTNNSMMHHPMHLHGHWMILRNGHGAYDPKLHTIDVAPGATAIADFDANASEGVWFFHCHHMYHMMSGMARAFKYDSLEEHNGTHHFVAHPPQLYLSSFLDIGADFGRDAQAISFKILYGKDDYKIELQTEDAEIKKGKIKRADVDVFYWHSISEFWAIKGGVNYVYRPADTPYIQPGIGIEGLMPYFIDTNIRAYYHQESFKLDLDFFRDTQITNNFFIRTGIRSILVTKTVTQDEVESGLNQLRYTVRPYYRLAPGITLFMEYEYEREYGVFKKSDSKLTIGLTLLF